MLRWGSLYARLEASGQVVSTMDSLIVATTLAHNAVLITRDEDHFRPTGVEIINSWNL
jgi:predicted nucleic acid-binding protein